MVLFKKDSPPSVPTRKAKSQVGKKTGRAELTKEEEEEFHELVREAKLKERQGILAHDTFKIGSAETLQVKMMGARWVLTWKRDSSGGWFVKARIVVKGFQDLQM